MTKEYLSDDWKASMQLSFDFNHMMADFGWTNTLLPQILPFMTNAFGIFLLRQYFMQVPDELIEADAC